jgi:pyruvate dehydrogenase complex dehydrogenase (E1) component
MKVGGHMASATSLSTILTALYCDVMGPDDRLAVKVCILTHCAIVLLCDTVNPLFISCAASR